MADCCSSGQGISSRGLEKQAGNALIAYVRYAMECSHEALKPVANIIGYLEGMRGTPNHRLLMRAWRCAAAWKAYLFNTNAETKAEADAATHWMLEWFDRENTTDGFQYGELLTTNHHQLYELGIFGVRYIAWSYRNSVITRVTEPVLEATGKHLRQARYLYDALSVDRHVLGPSCRCTPGGRTEDEQTVQMATVDVRTVCYALLGGWPAPTRLLAPHRQIAGRPNDENGGFWTYVYNVGVQYALQLVKEGDLLGGALELGEQPLLRDELRIERRGEDMIASFAHLTKTSHVCWYAGRRGGRFLSAPFRRGEVRDEDCPFPIPSLPGAEVLVIPGVHSTKGGEWIRRRSA